MADSNVGDQDPRYAGDSQIGTNLGSGKPTAENPGDVHPAVEPKAAPSQEKGDSMFQSIENPYALKEAVNKLESALDEIIGLFQGERETLAKDGSFSKGNDAITKFKGWKEELEDLKKGKY